jgi:hypothetical protein
LLGGKYKRGPGILLIYRTIDFVKLYEGKIETKDECKVYFSQVGAHTLMALDNGDKLILKEF